jgi:hypothetical protein
MKPAAPHETVEMCCKAALLLALLLGGCATAIAVRSLLTPMPPGGIRLDYDGEITLMKLVLNAGLPVALLATVGLGWRTYRARVIHLFSALLVVFALIGVFGCALAAWSGLVAIHGPEVNLWSQIWWR